MLDDWERGDRSTAEAKSRGVFTRAWVKAQRAYLSREIKGLEEAAQDLRGLLSANLKTQAPAKWAKTMMNVGYCRKAIGEIGADTAELREAQSIFEAVSEGISSNANPRIWSGAQINISSFLLLLDDLEPDDELLYSATERARLGLALVTPDKSPVLWVLLQLNLAVTLTRFAERLGDVEAFDEAADLLRTGLERFGDGAAPKIRLRLLQARGATLLKADDVKVAAGSITLVARDYDEANAAGASRAQWEAIQQREAAAVDEKVSRSIASMTEAIGSLEKALSYLSRDTHPAEWANVQNLLGAALLRLADRTHEPTDYDRAESAFRAAETVWSGTSYRNRWAQLQQNLGVTAFGRIHEKPGADYTQALDLLRRAETGFVALSLDWDAATASLPLINTLLLASDRTGSPLLVEAKELARRARPVLQKYNARSRPRPTEVYYLINRSTGKIDKIGIASDPGGRYSDVYLKAENVLYQTQYQYSSRYPAMVDENIRLTWYLLQNGELPRLNKVTR